MKKSAAWVIAGMVVGLSALAVVAAEEAPSGSSSGEAGSADASGQGSDGDRYAELVKLDGEFSETFVLPGVDFGRFNKIYGWEGQFEYRDVGPAKKTRSTLMNTRKQEFGISEEDRQKFEEIVGESFRKEMAKGKSFTIITDIGDVDANTLILRGALLDIISRVPPQYVGRSDIYLASIGAATFVMELIDASNGEVVALVAERREAETLNSRTGMTAMPTNSATVIGDIKRWAGSLARRLRTALDRAIAEQKKT